MSQDDDSKKPSLEQKEMYYFKASHSDIGFLLNPLPLAELVPLSSSLDARIVVLLLFAVPLSSTMCDISCGEKETEYHGSSAC